ncbi:4280_t:CDS:2 [Acaulospora colombiana]|uniref:4280_t:CDS:1 n=1 Tax=Acaulospora colombiana TaxID=27376 RepID=A0ACA9L3U3_9GLOM|nr:4280_t:CDS:2 [Acaulospora colombiana]
MAYVIAGAFFFLEVISLVVFLKYKNDFLSGCASTVISQTSSKTLDQANNECNSIYGVSLIFEIIAFVFLIGNASFFPLVIKACAERQQSFEDSVPVTKA